MITFKNITKTYNKDEIALNNISKTFTHGQIHGIIGVSGAGKSTLIRLFNKLEKYDTGTLDVMEYKDIRTLNKESTRMLRKQIGMVFQSDHLLSRKTVLENILLPITFHRKVTPKDIAYAKELLKEVHLSAYKNRYPSQLSGGQRQRVGIARALINAPKLLLCDEPTSALDVITTSQILNLIQAMAEKYNVNVIIVTHDMHVIKEICDTVTVMDNGHIVESGPINEILFKAKHNQTKAFIKEIGLDLTHILELFNKDELLLLKFDQLIVKKGLIAQLTTTLNVTISILYANIHLHKNGMMVIHAPSNQDQIIQFLRQHKVGVEHVV